jgi:hypothetical protein
MSIAMPCPRCKAKLKGPDQLVGRTVKCPGCGTPVTVTADAIVPPVSAPKPPESKERAAPKPAPAATSKKADGGASTNTEIPDDVGFKDDPAPAPPSPSKKPEPPKKPAPPPAKEPSGGLLDEIPDDVGFKDDLAPAPAPPPPNKPELPKKAAPSKTAKDAIPNMEIDDKDENDEEPYSDFEVVDDDNFEVVDDDEAEEAADEVIDEAAEEEEAPPPKKKHPAAPKQKAAVPPPKKPALPPKKPAPPKSVQPQKPMQPPKAAAAPKKPAPPQKASPAQKKAPPKPKPSAPPSKTAKDAFPDMEIDEGPVIDAEIDQEEIVDAAVDEEAEEAVVDAEVDEEEIVDAEVVEDEEVWVNPEEDEGEELDVVENDDDIPEVVPAGTLGDELEVVEEDCPDVSFRLLQLPRLHVRSQSGMFSMTNAYDLVNPKTKKKVGEALEQPETAQQLMRVFVSSNLTTTKIAVYDGRDLMMTIRRAPYFMTAKAEIFDADEEKLGAFEIRPFSALTGKPLWITDPDDKQLIKLEMKLFSGRRYFRNRKSVLLAEWVHETTYEKKLIKFKLAPRGNSFYLIWQKAVDERPRDKLLILGASLGLDLFQTGDRRSGVRFGGT